MTVRATQASPQALQHLPTKVRPKVDANDVQVPTGFTVEPILVGLSFPTDLVFGEDGTIFIGEGAAPGQPVPPCLHVS